MKLSNQNLEINLELLAAQDRLYAKAKTWVYLVFISSLTPLVVLALKYFFPNTAFDNLLVPIGLAGLAFTLAIDFLIQKKIDNAATIQEEFDFNVFGLDWNEGLVGSKVSKEIRIKAAGGYKIEPHRIPWYTAQIDNVADDSVQIILCQRESVMWERQLKLHIANILAWILGISVFLLVALTYFIQPKLPFADFVNQILIPVSGFLVASWKLCHSFNEVGKIHEDLNLSIEAEIEAFKKTKNGIPKERLRLFQDKIFQSRKKTCLVPDFLYHWFQSRYQKRTSKATLEYIKEINS